MKELKPRVSIGLPVFNGEKYLAEALDSLLAQTFADFEIIICDNASTDGTESICRDYERRDERIRCRRNSMNIGAAANFNLTYKLASGEYFKWAAHDDLHAPEFLARCVEVLDEDRSAVLCHTGVQFIDEQGEFVRNQGVTLSNTSSPDPFLRFVDLTSLEHWCFDIFGVIRTEAMKQTPLIAGYVGSDRNELVRLGLKGRFRRVPEALFFSRNHMERSVWQFKINYRAEWFDPKKRGSFSWPHWRIWAEYAMSVACADLNPREKIFCYLHLMKWARRYWRFVMLDAKEAVKHRVAQLRTLGNGRHYLRALS